MTAGSRAAFFGPPTTLDHVSLSVPDGLARAVACASVCAWPVLPRASASWPCTVWMTSALTLPPAVWCAYNRRTRCPAAPYSSSCPTCSAGRIESGDTKTGRHSIPARNRRKLPLAATGSQRHPGAQLEPVRGWPHPRCSPQLPSCAGVATLRQPAPIWATGESCATDSENWPAPCDAQRSSYLPHPNATARRCALRPTGGYRAVQPAPSTSV